jgi:WD40 repeat protein
MAFALSKRLAALGLDNGDSMIVHLEDGKCRTIATGHTDIAKGRGYGTFAVAISPDEKQLASAGRDGMVRLSDIASAKVSVELGKHYSWPEALAYSHDGKRLASAGQDGVIRIWDPVAGKEAVPTGGHGYAIWRAAISRDGKTAITDAHDDALHVWDCVTPRERQRIELKSPTTFSRMSPDGRSVIAIVGKWDSPDRTLKVWDAATGADITPAGFPKPFEFSGLQFTPDAKTIVAHDSDKLSAWEWPSGKRLWRADMPAPAAQPGVNHIDSISISPDGRQFITVAHRSWYREEKGLKFGFGADGVVDLWDTATGKHIRRLVEARSTFRPGIYAADGSYIHSGGGTLPCDLRGGSASVTRAPLCLIDPLTGRLLREFSNSGRAEGLDTGFTLALSADGKVLFRATQVGEVHLYEVATGHFRTALAGHRDMVLALDAPRDVRRLLSGSKDTTALLWDVGFATAKKSPLTAEDRAKAWEVLADTNGKAAYEAMVKLAADAEGFVALAGNELKPAPAGPKAEDLAPIFRDLDDKAFPKREAASAALEKHGESAMALVRGRLEIETSNEVRERLLRFLDKCDGPATVTDRLRGSRAIELLEHLATAEAKALLSKLAKGGPSRLTTDAAGAIDRLAER